ncbi:MAG: transcriptional regulator [Promethearchaeia archaeon]
MRPPCEIIVTTVLPALRSLVAKELIEEFSFSQSDAARKLGITQAAISQYLSHKRGDNSLEMLEALPEVESTVSEVATNIASETFSPFDTMQMVCKLCTTLRNNRFACTMHHHSIELPTDCRVCLE